MTAVATSALRSVEEILGRLYDRFGAYCTSRKSADQVAVDGLIDDLGTEVASLRQEVERLSVYDENQEVARLTAAEPVPGDFAALVNALEIAVMEWMESPDELSPENHAREVKIAAARQSLIAAYREIERDNEMVRKANAGIRRDYETQRAELSRLREQVATRGNEGDVASIALEIITEARTALKLPVGPRLSDAIKLLAAFMDEFKGDIAEYDDDTIRATADDLWKGITRLRRISKGEPA